MSTGRNEDKQRYQWSRYQKQCEICGESFTSRRSHAKYCSVHCRKVASRKRQGFIRTHYTHTFYCQQCGKQYFPAQPNQSNTYCSKACKQKAYRERKEADRD